MVGIVELDIGPTPATIPPKEKILVGTVQDMKVDLNRSNTCTFSMLDKVFITLGAVDLGLGPALISPIILIITVYHFVFIVIVIT